jgi:hypothetical protein
MKDNVLQAGQFFWQNMGEMSQYILVPPNLNQPGRANSSLFCQKKKRSCIDSF